MALAGAISSSLVKTAINIVLAAGDAYCGGPKVGKDEVLLRLRGAGISSLDDLASQIVNKQPQTPMPAEWITNSHIIIAMP
uniref:Uncharacterized protein n=1 Tax=Bradyrhizobium amphicarpaeae TaxID=1404768 RepID=A0A2U8Q034_9BRAD|nr:hypothetical protein CIT40_27500 [Bradyrhizobium amphicarpaeae]